MEVEVGTKSGVDVWKSVKFLHTEFLPGKGGHSERSERTEKHKEQYLFYPDPDNYMNLTEKYFYRSEDLRHLRLEQFHRYFSRTRRRCVEHRTRTFQAEARDLKYV